MHKQRGTAVFTALLVVAIAASVAVAIMTQQRIDIRRTEQLLLAEAAREQARGVLFWAMGALKNIENIEQQTWPMLLPTTLLEDKRGVVQGQISNFTTLLNANDVESKPTEWMTLLTSLPEPMDQSQAQSLLQAIREWTNSGKTLADENYLSFKPPYVPAHRPFISISELRLVQGVSAPVYRALSERVAVYPKGDSGSYFLVRADVLFGQQPLTVYSLLQRTLAEGKVTVNVLWQSRGSL